jgi:hypothetical protein
VDYSQFNHLEEFREDVTLWMVDYKNQFTRNEQIALQRLILFAEKVPGVCNAKIGTMLKRIYEDRGELGMISRSSFKRMLQKAIKFGIITVYETVRKNGSQFSNLYVFNRYTYWKQEKSVSPYGGKTLFSY